MSNIINKLIPLILLPLLSCTEQGEPVERLNNQPNHFGTYDPSAPLSWSTALNAKGYDILLDGEFYATTAGTTYEISGFNAEKILSVKAWGDDWMGKATTAVWIVRVL